MVDAESRPTSVYRYYDAGDVLIYVGITNQGMGRNRQHNGSKEWWPYVARQEVDHYRSRADALRNEERLIKLYLPPFNTVHNREAVDKRAAYLALAVGSEEPVTLTPEQIIKKHGGHRIPLRRVGAIDDRLIFSTEVECFSVVKLIDVAPMKGMRIGGRRSVIQSVTRHNRLLLISVSGTDFNGYHSGWLMVRPNKARGGVFVVRGIELHSRMHTVPTGMTAERSNEIAAAADALVEAMRPRTATGELKATPARKPRKHGPHSKPIPVVVIADQFGWDFQTGRSA